MTTPTESSAITPGSGLTTTPTSAPADLRGSAARSLRWTLLESVGLTGLSLLVLMVLARQLTPADFGTAAVALGIVQMLGVLVDMLFHDALIRTPDASARHFDTAFTASLLLAVLLTAACWLLADRCADLIGQPAVAPVLRWMSLGLLASGCSAALVAMQRRHLRFRTLALRATLGRIGAAAIGIGLALAGAGVWSLVAQQVAAVALAAAALWALAPERPGLRLSRPELVEMARFGVPATGFSLLSLSSQRVFMIAVASFLGAQVAGILSLAFRIVDMLRDIVAGAVSQLALPFFARLEGKPGNTVRAYEAGVRLTTAVMYPLFAGLAVCSEDVVVLLFGPRWLEAAPYVTLLALLTFQFHARLFSVPLYNAAGHPAYPYAALLPQLAYLVVGMLLVGRHSPAAAAAVWASRLVLGLAIDLWLLRRVTGMSPARQLAGALRPALAAAAMAALVYGVKLYGLAAWTPAPRLAAMVALGAAVYAALLWLLHRGLVLELLAFARQVAARRAVAGSA